jgi:DNA-binding IclR family transcriptional regulator
MAAEERAEPESRSGVQVLARAITILHALEQSRDGLSLGDIARRVALPRATVQRIIETLADENFVVGAGEGSGLRLGPALIALAAAARNNVAEIARPHLAALSRSTGETVDLSIYENRKAVFLDQIVGSHRLRAVSAIGKSFELHCAANGKAMLATLPAGDLDSYARKKLGRFTPHTVTSWPQLKGELDAIGRSGVAFDREEQSLGICAVGTAFHDAARGLYAISIPTPTQRFAGREDLLSQALLECRSELVAVLGSSTPST